LIALCGAGAQGTVRPVQESPYAVPASLRPTFTAGGTISRSISALFDKPLVYMLLSLVVLLPIGGLVAYMVSAMNDPAFQQAAREGTADFPVGIWIIQLLAMLWFAPGFGALIHASASHLQGKPIEIGASLGAGLRRSLPLIGVYFIFSIVVGVGTLLLIVPGFILMCVYYMSIPVAVLERRGVFGSLSRGAELSKGYRTTLFAIGAGHVGVSIAVYLGCALVTMLLTWIIGSVAGPKVALVAFLPMIVVYIGLMALLPIMISASYIGLREEKEGGSADQVAGVFT
jgi:hypothetical protein